MIQEAAHAAKLWVHEHSNELFKGSVGFLSSIAGIGMSALQEVEQWLRLASLCAGIMVALVTTWSILKKNRDKEDKK